MSQLCRPVQRPIPQSLGQYRSRIRAGLSPLLHFPLGAEAVLQEYPSDCCCGPVTCLERNCSTLWWGDRGAQGDAAGLGGTSLGVSCDVNPSALPGCRGIGAESRRQIPPCSRTPGALPLARGAWPRWDFCGNPGTDRGERLKPSVLPLLTHSIRGACFAMTLLQMLSFYSQRSHLWRVPRVPNTRVGAEGRAGGHNHPLI